MSPRGQPELPAHPVYGVCMIVRRILAILTVIVTLWAPVAHAQSVTGTVTRVVDGDTVDVRVDGKVERIRIIGLDTPETVDPRKAVQCFGREASAHAKELLPLGTPVTLEADPTQDSRDKYGRMLAFILFETDPGTIANFTEVMIAGGVRPSLRVPPSVDICRCIPGGRDGGANERARAVGCGNVRWTGLPEARSRG